MAQTLLLGLGGTGSRVVNIVAKELRKKSIGINDGNVCCAVLDTNLSDTGLIRGTKTGIPIIETSRDDMTVADYLGLYANSSPTKWCPTSNSFLRQTMTDGASEMRVKSRLAFMDVIKSGAIGELESHIGQILNLKDDGKIRVMLVTSLSGGTGSGMFIQTALWIRKFFDERNCECTIRGIFLLPDIFVRGSDTIKMNPRKIMAHYANTYAAIRELNAFNKVLFKGEKLDRRVVIDDLFDSDISDGRQIFDFAFFVDAIDARGGAFDSIPEYEEIAAQMVYMQLYAPMKNELYSVEDNLFTTFEDSDEPMFGACGTAKAVYPQDEILKYCALRAARDSLEQSWGKIDAEIDALKKEEDALRKDGIVRDEKLDPRAKYIEQFEYLSSRTGEQIGTDRLFVTIGPDIKNEHTERVGGEVQTTYTNKVSDFLDFLEQSLIDTSVVRYGGLAKVLVDEDLPDPDKPEDFNKETVDNIKAAVDAQKSNVASVLKTFEEEHVKIADRILSDILPLDMGSVNRSNQGSLYGLFVKKDNTGLHFVHPLAARYLVYKLKDAIAEKQGELTVDTSKDDALQGKTEVSFDNEKTRETETIDNYLDNLKRFGKKGQISTFLKRFSDHSQKLQGLCQEYETQLLKSCVYQKLQEKLEALAKLFERFFKRLPEVNEQIDKKIAGNIEKTESLAKKTLFVNATKLHKEAKYQSLGLDLSDSNEKINESIITTIYGKFCAEFRSSILENQKYVKLSVGKAFVKGLVESYTLYISKTCRDEIAMDIVSALIQEREVSEQYDLKKVEDEEDEKEDYFSEDDAEEQERVNTRTQVLRDCAQKLLKMAVPFLIAKKETAIDPNDADSVGQSPDTMWFLSDSDPLFMPIQTPMIFWGFHPDVADTCPDLEKLLKANRATSQSALYGKNELFCYRSLYGVKANAIAGFNEKADGKYYKAYRAAVENMIKKNNYVRTPHMDKTWHEFLPYVSEGKQSVENVKFYKDLWLAVAYGQIKLNDKDRFQILKQVGSTSGKTGAGKPEDLLSGGKEIRSTEIDKLVRELQQNSIFQTEIVPKVEKKFAEELADLANYAESDILKGLTRSGKLNAVDMIIRYNVSAGSDYQVTVDLAEGIESIAEDLAENYRSRRKDEKVDLAKWRIIEKIYDSGKLTEGKTETFDSWLESFEEYGLKK